MDVINRLAVLLQEIPLPENLPELQLEPGEVERACAEYTEWFDRA